MRLTSQRNPRTCTMRCLAPTRREAWSARRPSARTRSLDPRAASTHAQRGVRRPGRRRRTTGSPPISTSSALYQGARLRSILCPRAEPDPASRPSGYSRRHYVGRTISTTSSYRTPAAAAIWSMLWPAVKSRRISSRHSRSARLRRRVVLRSASNSSAMPH